MSWMFLNYVRTVRKNLNLLLYHTICNYMKEINEDDIYVPIPKLLQLWSLNKSTVSTCLEYLRLVLFLFWKKLLFSWIWNKAWKMYVSIIILVALMWRSLLLVCVLYTWNCEHLTCVLSYEVHAYGLFRMKCAW